VNKGSKPAAPLLSAPSQKLLPQRLLSFLKKVSTHALVAIESPATFKRIFTKFHKLRKCH